LSRRGSRAALLRLSIMDDLLARAKKFLDDNPYLNEIELQDGFNNRVRVVRNAPVIWGWQWQPTYPYWTVNQP
jgi:hypothetical protein